MLATVSFALGILLAGIVLAVTRRETDAARSVPGPTALGWWTFAFGLTALIAFALAFWLMSAGNMPGFGLLLVSIAFSFAALLIGAEILMWVDRYWQTWAGLAAGLVPVIFLDRLLGGQPARLGKINPACCRPWNSC